MSAMGVYVSGRFTQRTRRCCTAQNGLPSDNVLCVSVGRDGRVIAGTDAGLACLARDVFRPIADQTLQSPVRRIRALKDGTPVILSGNTFYNLTDDTLTCLQSFDAPAVDFCHQRGLYWYLTETELCCMDPADGSVRVRRSLEGGTGLSLAVSSAQIYAATQTNISVIHGKRNEWKNIAPFFSDMPDAAVRAMRFDSAGHLWVGTDSGAAVYDNTGFWLTVNKLQMLPKNAVRAIAFADNGDVWFATDAGLAFLRRGALKYFTAERWVPSDNVRDIAISADGKTVYAATDRGISVITEHEMTLAEKEAIFEEQIEAYHVRHGFVATRTIRQNNMADGYVEITDNDGLWTAVNVAAQSMRYAVTGDKDALRKARRGMQAALLLMRITGIPGFTARAVRYPGEIGYGNGHKEWSISPDGSCEWRGETSSDEMTGHYFGASLYYDLCADSDEKDEIRRSVCAITDHIITNEFRLVDRDGLPTTWACWDPALLNHDDKWFYERGVNSLELLAFLKVSAHISGDTRYDALYRKMITKHHYVLNAAMHKIKDAHICHIDDNLAFLAVFTLLRLEDDPSIRALLLCGMEDHWQYERTERQPLFCFLHALYTGRDADLIEGVQSLREMSPDTILYGMENSARKDLIYDTEQDRFHAPRQLLHALPYDECNVHRPDSSFIFRPDCASFSRAQEPTYFLLPYWIARYYGLLKEADQ